MTSPTLGQIVYAFLLDYLPVTKGLRPTSIASYRDGLRLFLQHVARASGRALVALPVNALTADHVLAFLRSLEVE